MQSGRRTAHFHAVARSMKLNARRDLLAVATVCCVWDSRLPPGAVLNKADSRRNRRIVLRGAEAPLRSWLNEQRAVAGGDLSGLTRQVWVVWALVAADRCRDSARRPTPFLFCKKERKQRKVLNNSFYVTPLDCFTHGQHRLACSAGSDRVSTCQAGAADRHLGGQAAGVSFGHDCSSSPPGVSVS